MKHLLLLTPTPPSPREFGSRLMKLQSLFVRILEERGLSGCFFYLQGGNLKKIPIQWDSVFTAVTQ